MTYLNSTEIMQLHGYPLYMTDMVDACLRARLNLFFIGDTGSGKTQLVHEFMHYFGDKTMFLLGRNDMDTRELFQQINLGKLYTKPSYNIEPLVNPDSGDVEWYYPQISTGGGIILTGNDLQYTDSSSFENLFTVSSIGEALFKTETGNDSTTAFQVQNAAGITLLGIDTTNSRIFSGVADGASAIGFTFNTTNNYSTSGAKLLSVQNATSEKFSIDKDGHIVTYGHIKSTQTTAPTIGTPSSCGTSPTSAVTANSTDSAGSVTINTGSGSPTTCNTIVTFNRGYGTAPKAVIVSGKNANTELSDVYVSATSTTTFTISAPAASVSPSDTWEIYYWVVE